MFSIDILKEYLKRERPLKNLKRENAENVGFYKTKKDLEIEMSKHRREVLQKVAVLYKQEKSEFIQKYRLF